MMAMGGVNITLEDETGSMNVIVRQKIWQRDRTVARSASVMIVHGTIQQRNDCTHVIATRLEALTLRAT